MWQEPDAYPSEPIFVSHPDALEEDDGNAGGLVALGLGKGCASLAAGLSHSWAGQSLQAAPR